MSDNEWGSVDQMALDRTTRSKVFAFTKSNFETLFTGSKVLLMIRSSKNARSNVIRSSENTRSKHFFTRSDV
jgi:hypothetical protein